MKRLSLYFVAPRKISICEDQIPELSDRQVLVQSIVSLISHGTEMLVYRNQFPKDIPVDSTITYLHNNFRYPLKYGYSIVGKIISCGDEISHEWENRVVFAFHPHESHFIASLDDLIPVPSEISIEEASFLPNVETAVNLVMDGRPVIGERIVVFGQGIIGLLTTAILADFPLSGLLTLDKYPIRRKKSIEVGANYSLDPLHLTEDVLRKIGFTDTKSDLTYELSGNPEALETALKITGYAGRLVVGSWYGRKTSHLNLGGRFHRDRIRIISSQVSTIDPQFLGRWNKSRRLEVVWEMVKRIRPSNFITQRFSISQAEKAYSLIDENPEKTIQVLFTY